MSCDDEAPLNHLKYYKVVGEPKLTSYKNTVSGAEIGKGEKTVDTANIFLMDYDKNPILDLWFRVCVRIDNPGKEIIVFR